MSNWPESFLGSLVRAGYMVSYHEGLAYLHNTLGQRWAEIDPHGITIMVTFYNEGKANTTAHVNDMRELLALEEMA
jgi:hypothetical protein